MDPNKIAQNEKSPAAISPAQPNDAVARDPLVSSLTPYPGRAIWDSPRILDHSPVAPWRVNAMGLGRI